MTPVSHMTPARFYFSDLSITEKIDFQEITLITKTKITRVFSSEGIFHVKDNKMMKLNIKDRPIENITIQDIEFIVDKSSIKYDVDWYQINPYHIMETIDVYTYVLCDDVQLILEKQDKHTSSIYFLINDIDNIDINNIIVTFLSGLNLC